MIKEFMTGFYNLLKGSAPLLTKIGGVAPDYKIYHIVAPDGSQLPYITYGLLTDDSQDTFSKKGAIEEGNIWVNVHTKTSPANATEIADLILSVADNATITVTGYSSLLCKRDFIGSMMFDPDTRAYLLPMRYRLLLGKN